MAQSADDHDQASFRAGAFIPIVFFLGPVVTAIMPRLAPLLLLIVGFALIVAGLRRGLGWREFLAPNPAMIALAVVAAYAALSAIWAAEPDDALLKPAVMLGAMFAVFAAARSISSLEPKRLREASIALIAGALCAALFVTIEFVTPGCPHPYGDEFHTGVSAWQLEASGGRGWTRDPLEYVGAQPKRCRPDVPALAWAARAFHSAKFPA